MSKIPYTVEYLQESDKTLLSITSTVSPNMLFCGLFIASSPKSILETLTDTWNG
jgi:hypothetical protein